ncbi:UDP-2,4-diacetamido-2,4,6-trideoxy-beta-L-altropyranose hydrolase [Marinobacter sediminicola]|uniref:UDP-2,4-diacetamido-2,4, 6-trideoxy-beta-L-altropyranose hydrolase n=1 Tax=Marinobacter sediminicola TaxID=3072994 RepID=UPI002810C29D|nr:UDP-2,4-diacetamido-2,4,6-trideoxy-beta-L-altropyranose hydrolase [Marinobacter sp. F26243]
MLVAFRADASVQIGTGHLMRCLTLADELTRQGHECQFICREHRGHLGELIASKGYELTLLPVASSAVRELSVKDTNTYADWLGAPWQEDAAQTVEALAPLKADWLVVDHYALNARWEQQLAKVVGQIMVIDDLADRNHECAVLLDQNLGRKPSDYDGRVPEDCQRLIGSEYALLRPEFAAQRECSLKRRAQPELKRILISLGGVDRTNVTGQVLEALAATELPKDTHLDIVMGAAAPYLEEVRQQAARLPFKTTVSVNVSDMAERMSLADLSIGAAGGTSWERCCLGLPAVLVVQAENQFAGARALEASGAALTITDPKTVQAALPSELAKAGELDCLQRMSNAAAGITDGKGAAGVVQSMVSFTGRAQ